MAAAGNSRFAVTCGLLRQYMMREQHKHQPSQPQMAASSLPRPPLREATEDDADARTMQLFPTQAGTSEPPSTKQPEEQATAPLTIFYDGRMIVFEDFPADRAQDLMQLAGSRLSPAPKNEVAVVPKKPSAGPSDMPIARKESLERFLQKRKHRIVGTDPYHKETAPEKNAVASKAVKDEPASSSWLAL